MIEEKLETHLCFTDYKKFSTKLIGLYPNNAGTLSTKVIQNVNNELMQEILSNVTW
jgi:hypothetical protein